MDGSKEAARPGARALGLIALDLDGTLVGTDGEMPAATVRSLRRAAAAGLHVTIITGRALPGLRQVLGAAGAAVLGASPLVGVEYGTRIVRLDGSGQACHEPLPDRLVAGFLSGLPLGAVEFVAYYPRDRAGRSVVWVPSPGSVPQIAAGMTDAEVGSGSTAATLARLSADRPSKIMVRLRPGAPGGTLGGTWRAGRNLNLLASKQTKGVALLRVCGLLGVRLAASVAAGDHQADAAMLWLVPRGQRIVVGHDAGLAAMTSCLRVTTPADLGPAIGAAMLKALGQPS